MLAILDSVSSIAVVRSRWLRWVSVAAGVVLVMDALVLMTYGKFNVGIVVPLVLGAALLVIVGKRQWIDQQVTKRPRFRLAWRWFWALIALWTASLLIFWICVAVQLKDAGARDEVDAIIVLGSSTPAGQPSAALAERLDLAAQIASGLPKALIVTSGGVDYGETLSEGLVMANYLIAVHGVDSRRIIPEEKSTSTALNLEYSLRILRDHGIPGDARIAIVTSDFHTLRARWIARKSGVHNPITAGAPTPRSIRFNAWLREYFAVGSGLILGEF